MIRFATFLGLFLGCLTFNAQSPQLTYPLAKKSVQKDIYFGNVVEDPYRWMEAQFADETQKWVDEENKLSQKYLNDIPGNFTLQEQIKRNAFVEYLSPEKHGKYYFELRSAFNGKEMKLYFTEDIKKGYWDELFINKDLGLKKGEVVSIQKYSVSKNAKYIAYAFDADGSDWSQIKVADLDKLKNLDDHLYNIKMSSIVWRGNGFYYTKMERTSDSTAFTQAHQYPKLYYHKLGTTQENDSLIFKRDGAPHNFFTPTVTRNERFLIIEDCNLNTNYRSFYYFDFNDPYQKSLLPLIKKTGKAYRLLTSRNDDLMFFEKNHEEKKIININIKNPAKHTQLNKIADDIILRDVIYYNEKFFEICFYNQQEYIVIINDKGDIIKKVEMPYGAECSFTDVDESNQEILLKYSSVLHPSVLAALKLSNLTFDIIEPVKINYTMDDFMVEKVMYKSDTAMVPMLLVHKKKMKMDGTNPVLLEFYGGYGSINIPNYNAGRITFLENGGVYAYAMIRGGGEKGTYWHRDGQLFNRHKSIDDVINASLFLTEKGYSVPSKIAITGASHGGFIAAAAMVKRPKLFGAVVPVVGVYDMLRFEKFTIGSLHKDEDGTVKDSADYFYLKTFSPLHNVKKDVVYPPVLFMTSDHDDRVPPLHSYKMVATMQELASKETPVLLRVEKNAGHNGARTYDKYIDELTDFYSFILNALEVKGFK